MLEQDERYYRNNYIDDTKHIEDVLAYLYRHNEDKLAQVVLDRERLLNEAWGSMKVLENPPTGKVIDE